MAVSEVLLQQTQAARVVPVYAEFVRRFPTIDDLHRAPAKEVSALTDPLGYHVRGRWLKAMAATVVTEFGGRMPDSLDELRRLPGLGPYAAAAVHTFGNGKRAPLVDTNIARVYTRAVGLPAEGPVYQDSRRLAELAEALTPARRFYDYGQGLMDLGATVCTARSPACPKCPLRRLCRDVQGRRAHRRLPRWVAGNAAPGSLAELLTPEPSRAPLPGVQGIEGRPLDVRDVRAVKEAGRRTSLIHPYGVRRVGAVYPRLGCREDRH